MIIDLLTQPRLVLPVDDKNKGVVDRSSTVVARDVLERAAAANANEGNHGLKTCNSPSLPPFHLMEGTAS